MVDGPCQRHVVGLPVLSHSGDLLRPFGHHGHVQAKRAGEPLAEGCLLSGAFNQRYPRVRPGARRVRPRPAGRLHPPEASRYVTMAGSLTMARTILSFGIILLVVACAPGRLQDQPSPPAVVTPGSFIPTVPPPSPSPSSRT